MQTSLFNVYPKNEALNLLNKINEISVENEINLDAGDQSKMVFLQAKYEQARNYYSTTLNQLNKLNNELRQNIDYFVQPINLKSKIKNITESNLNLNRRFVSQIVEYFNAEYNLNSDISFKEYIKNEKLEELEREVVFSARNDKENYLEKREELDKLKNIEEKKEFSHNTRLLNYKEFVSELMVFAGGSFSDKGNENVKKTFLNKVGFYPNHSTWMCENLTEEMYNTSRSVIKNKKIILTRYYLDIEANYSGGYRFGYNASYENSGRTVLIKALNLFFNNELSSYDNYFVLGGGDEFNYKEIYGTKEISIKCYKNDRVDLIFTSHKKAEDFYNFFALYSKDERA